MKVLVICGECVQVNTSSNLCCLAYLKGLVDAGNEVTLLSADNRGYSIDPDMVIPLSVKHYTYRGMTFYEKLSELKKKTHKQAQHTTNQNKDIRSHKSIVSIIKKKVFSLYGVHGTYIKFERKARRFRSEEDYDIVISLSTPATSHLIAYCLLNSGHVKSKNWVQVWEDPWYGDMDGYYASEEVLREEKRILGLADRVCYVSPITLEYQKNRFPESAHKMFWVPLPSYYYENEQKATSYDKYVFGYFGEYCLPARNLKPFYQAAKKTGIEVNICGNSNLGLESTSNIHIYPRLELSRLRPIEDSSNVLVFLCNCKGGQIPGKIYQYAATDKKILFILDGTYDEKRILKEFFGKFNRFVFCENNQESIQIGINNIINNKIGNVKNIPLLDFSSDNIVRQILKEGTKLL